MQTNVDKEQRREIKGTCGPLKYIVWSPPLIQLTDMAELFISTEVTCRGKFAQVKDGLWGNMYS